MAPDVGRFQVDAFVARIGEGLLDICDDGIQFPKDVLAGLGRFMAALGQEQAPRCLGTEARVAHHLPGGIDAVHQERVHSTARRPRHKNVQVLPDPFSGMRGLAAGLVVLLFVPLASAQLPHPHDAVVHHPLTIESEMRAIAAKNPEFISMASFGKSTLGFDLWLLDFVAPEVRASASELRHTPVFYLDANHHGNEQLGMEALLIFLEELADWSLTDEGATRLSEVRVVGAPMINPDGTGRSNRVNSNFVDLNRNYDYNWGLYGTSGTADPTGGTYRGSKALSEPESSANAMLMANLQPRVYLSMHTGSHDIVLPWRQTPEADGPMPDWPLYEQYLGEILNVSGLGYRDPSGAGESISHAYGNIGSISLIVEVDQLQTQVAAADIRERLVEEVLIFWMTLEHLERIGGHLVADGPNVCNDGWGAAYNVTSWGVAHDYTMALVAEELAPGDCVSVPMPADGSGLHINYHPTAQAAKIAPGPTMLSVSQLNLAGSVLEPVAGSKESIPGLGIIVLVGLVAGFALRRRAA